MSIDALDCDPAALRSKEQLKTLIDKVIVISKMQKLGQLVVRELPEDEENKKLGTDGVTLIQAIHTSSIILHAVPSRAALHFDMLSCKEFNAKSVLLLVLGATKAKSHATHSFTRPASLEHY